MVKKTRVLLIVILLIAFLLRVWVIDLIPFGFTPDEASFGYDSYSLFLTGKDQWGHTLPIVLESFGDFKLPLYSYLAIPSVAIFGLTKFAVRLPNALLGTAAVYITYLLVNKLSGYGLRVGGSKEKIRNTLTRNGVTGLVAAILLTISPWHIMMSRGAFEANLTTFFMPLGVYFFLCGLENRKYFLFSALVFGLNLFSYHSARLVTPLLVAALIMIYGKVLAEKEQNILRLLSKYKYAISIFSLFLGLSLYSLFLGGGKRAKDISIFSGSLEQASQERFIALYQGIPLTTAKIFHNKYQIATRRFLGNYSQYLSFNYLFLNGPAEGTYGMIPGRGVIYLFELPFIILFFHTMFKAKDKKPYFLILAWLFLAPIPASLTSGRGYAGNRSVIMLPALTIVSAIGAIGMFSLMKNFKRSYFKLSLFVYLFICLFSFGSFLEDYFFLSSYKTSKDMLWGNLEVAGWLKENGVIYKNILLSKELSEPHIYIAFANKWDPSDYQENAKDWQEYKSKNLKFVDQMESYSLGKYIIESIKYKPENPYSDILMVGKPDVFPTDIKPRIKFVNPKGETVIVAFEPTRQAYAQKID